MINLFFPVSMHVETGCNLKQQQAQKGNMGNSTPYKVLVNNTFSNLIINFRWDRLAVVQAVIKG